VAHMGEDRGVHRVLVGKNEGKLPLGRTRHRWGDNIKMAFQEVGGGSWGLDGFGLEEGQLAGTCGYCEELSSSINAGNILTSW
jgi:hypothetical protein